MSDAPHPSSTITPETARAFLPGSFPGDLGIEPLEIEDSHSRGRIVVDERHLHPGGFVHGGVWTALGDTVAAWATFRAIPPEHNFTTIELKLNVFAAGLLGDEIVAVGEPLHAGKSTVVIEVRMERLREGAEPRLAANLIVSQFVLAPQGAGPAHIGVLARSRAEHATLTASLICLVRRPEALPDFLFAAIARADSRSSGRLRRRARRGTTGSR